MRARSQQGTLRARWLLAGMLGVVSAPALAQDSAIQATGTADTLRLSLRATVERALAVGEEMRLAEAAYQSAVGQYKQARSDVFPQLSLNSGYTRQFESVFRQEGGITDISAFVPDTTAALADRVRALEDALPTAPLASLSGLFDAGPFASAHRYDVSLGVTQKVFEGGSIIAAVGVARHALRSYENRRGDRKAEVRMQVREAYLGALLADRAVEIAELGLEQADTQLRRVRARQEAGQTAEFDLLQAEVQRDNQLPLVKAAQNARATAYLQLCRLANLPVNVPLVLTTPLLGDVALPADPFAAVDTTGIYASALGNLGITALEEELRARDAAITVAGRDYWPALSLFANYSNQAFPTDGWPGGDDWLQDVNAGAVLNWKLFDGFRTSGLVHTTRAEAAMAEYNLQLGREAIQLVVEQQVGELERAASLLLSRARTVQVAQRAQELANLRYEEGASSLLEVEDSRTAYQVAQGSEATARHDYLLALARLERYTGRPLFTDLARQVGTD